MCVEIDFEPFRVKPTYSNSCIRRSNQNRLFHDNKPNKYDLNENGATDATWAKNHQNFPSCDIYLNKS